MEDFYFILIKFWYTILIVFILARLFYYRYNGKKELLFTYILLSAIISMLCVLISRVEISLGFAIGIFAIFGIIRYRTTQVTPREMTYLFLCAGVAAKNILAPEDAPFSRIIISDIAILLIAGLAEYFLFSNNTSIGSKEIIYNNLELIHPEKRKELESDLDVKFGISGITKIKVIKINTVKNFARIIVEFKPDPKGSFIE